MSQLNPLHTFPQQRDYLINTLGITRPLSVANIERIAGEVAFPTIHKLEVALHQERDALTLTPNSAITKQRIVDLEAELTLQLEPVAVTIKALTKEEGEAKIRKAKAIEIMAEAKVKILTLADELTASANKYDSIQLAELSHHVRALSL